MGIFDTNISSISDNKLSQKGEGSIIFKRVDRLQSEVARQAVVSALQGVGIKHVEAVETKYVNRAGFKSVTQLAMTGHSPLRAGVLIQTKGYEAYTPSEVSIANAYKFIGDLDCHTVYLLETDDGFILAHEDKMLGYRLCPS